MQSFLYSFLLLLFLSQLSRGAETQFVFDANRLERWITAQQYTNASLGGYGAMRQSPSPVAYGPGLATEEKAIHPRTLAGQLVYPFRKR